MKLKFKHQDFQQDAVRAVVDCFQGQPNERSKCTGVFSEDAGFKNRELIPVESEVLDNIREVQQKNGIKISERLEGNYNLTIEMETGTGKTYTYIKTMFELNRTYGWSKFIIVVPSIAIREGVFKSFQITDDHFMEEYGTRARYFIYNSKQLHNIENFASDSGINVMIINSQAFAARGKDARRIYMELDEFQSRKPIDVIAGTNPILIIDEPQSVEGEKTKEALKSFNPLFTLRYSATHRFDYNKVYRLDALDAYNMKLVKKINVKGITIKGATGTNAYLYLEGIDLSNKQAPIARIEYEEKGKNGLKRVTRKVRVTNDLYQLSGNLEQYKGYKLSEINGASNSITFMNGVRLLSGDVQGDVNELSFRQIQIRETIKSHFEKERSLFYKGVKVLSLFFIDEVAKYRQYDTVGHELNGEYATIFEAEYNSILSEYLNTLEENAPYLDYLKTIKVKETHKGYFSIDKKNKRLVDPKVSAKENASEDVDAYDLIMKEKERLLGFKDPTRFIFSHSALREGWDNPNVFQICTLKHSDSTIKKRQEVGRGLRLCVNQEGERMDSTVPGLDVHDMNILTVVASESYEAFARQLQGEIAEALSERPQKADISFFLSKVLHNERGETLTLDEALTKKLYRAFIKKDYIDEGDILTQNYFTAAAQNQLDLPEEFSQYQEQVIELVKSIYKEGESFVVGNERKNNIKELKPNPNFYKKEFQEFWHKINQKTAYTVRFDSEELIQKCIKALDQNLAVTDIQFRVYLGELGQIDSKEQLAKGEALVVKQTQTGKLQRNSSSNLRYDLVGKLVSETRLTRRTIVKVLRGIQPETFKQFQRNPEEFIIRVGKIINEQKATTVIERISYDVINETFDASIFTKNSLGAVASENALTANKHIYDYVITDSEIERKFAKELDTSKEVGLFAKLPRGFYIPTPVGDYNPDWAIVFNEGDVRTIYFIAETKGSMDSLELREIEQAKIHCAQKHFEKISRGNIKYDVVSSFEKLLELVRR